MIRKHIEELPSGKIYRIRGITSFLAAAALIVVAVALLLPGGEQFRLQSESIERSTLIGLNSRSPSDNVTRTYESGEKAALAAFRDALTYDNAEFRPRSPLADEMSPVAGHNYSVTIDYPFMKGTFTYDATAIQSMTVSSVPQYYMLTLPSRSLYTLDADRESISANWNIGRVEYICLTLVYQTDGGFSATPARVFSTQ